jgi:hypothetical protein
MLDAALTVTSWAPNRRSAIHDWTTAIRDPRSMPRDEPRY